MEVKYLSEDKEAVALAVLNDDHPFDEFGMYFNFYMDDLHLKPDKAGVWGSCTPAYRIPTACSDTKAFAST